MKSRKFLITILYFLFLVSGSLYGVGEKTISLGGASGWEMAGLRERVTEVSMVRPDPVLVLSSAASGSLPGQPSVDLSLSFDEGDPARFRDATGHYRITASPSLTAVDRRYARAGFGAVLFPGASPAGGNAGGPLVLEPQSRDALFSPNSLIRDFTLEFWLHPLNMENGEQIFRWISSRPVRQNKANEGSDFAFQRIFCVSSKNRLEWSFLGFFSSPGGMDSIDINISGVTAVVPKTWSHHLIRFDSNTGMIEYLMNGKSEAIEYATSTGREGGGIYTPVTGENGSFILGGGFSGMMDEFRIHGVYVPDPAVRKYALYGGRMETKAIDLGMGNNGILAVDASGGRTLIQGARIGGEFRQNGRFRFSDDSEMQFFIRTSDNPYYWNDSPWLSVIPGADLAGAVRGRYVQLAVDFYPSANGEASPYLEELRITYLPDEPPLPPVRLTAVAMDGAVQLHWKNSPNTDIQGYFVYYGTASGDYFGGDAILGVSPIDAGKHNTIYIDGLKNGSLYYFCVAAYKRPSPSAPVNTGEFSSEVRARPLQGLPSLSFGN